MATLMFDAAELGGRVLLAAERRGGGIPVRGGVDWAGLGEDVGFEGLSGKVSACIATGGSSTVEGIGVGIFCCC